MKADQSDGTATGPALASMDDERITSIGSTLRRYRLDELPQLWNVIRGEMLLIGSRPEAPPFVAEGEPQWQQVLAVPPGIGGLSQLLLEQVEGELSAVEDWEFRYRRDVQPLKLQVDHWYLQNGSPTLDLLIVLAIFERVVLRRTNTCIQRRGRVDSFVAAASELAVKTKS